MTATIPEQPQTQKVALRDAIVIFVFAALCFSYDLASTPLSGTEGHRAITAHQMVQRGNYLVPTLYGYTYLKKPPLDYWVLAGFEKVLGAHEWVWRLPSVMAMALMAAIVALMTARWFDRIAGIAAGIACVSLVALWSQTRSADIDSLNTLASVVAALAFLDLSWNPRAGKWGSTLLAATFFGAGLLLKGPGCLPVVLGAIVGPMLLLKSAAPLKRTNIYIAIAIGILLFLAWLVPLGFAMHVKNVVPDTGGVDEAKQRMLVSNFRYWDKVVLLPFILVAYGLPVTPGILVPVIRPLRRAFEPGHEQMIIAVAGAIIGAFVIDICAGVQNPRYGYPVLPLFCPLIGAVAYACHQRLVNLGLRKLLMGILMIVCLAFAFTFFVIAFLAHKQYQLTPAIKIAAPFVLVVGIWTTYHALRANIARTIPGLCILIATASLAFSEFKNQERFARSAYLAAQALKQSLPPNTPVTTWYTLWAQPELFYYAGVETIPKMGIDPWNEPLGEWLVFYDDEEWDKYPKPMKDRFSKPIVLSMDLRRKGDHHAAYLVQVVAPPANASTRPASQGQIQ